MNNAVEVVTIISAAVAVVASVLAGMTFTVKTFSKINGTVETVDSHTTQIKSISTRVETVEKQMQGIKGELKNIPPLVSNIVHENIDKERGHILKTVKDTVEAITYKAIVDALRK